jgi:hypothetical protein
MATMAFRLPDAERGIIWRYLDGVSQALARRFERGSSPGEENLTFLLCELLDEGTTALHLLEYPLSRAKEDLAKADGGITLDVSFQTHEHTKHVEHHFSGADLGVIFVVDHPYFGRSEKAILLQAKRLFPSGTHYNLKSSFSSFHPTQLDQLKTIANRFSAAANSIFYLWYAPSSKAFSEDDAKIIRSLEAAMAGEWRALRGWHPFWDEMIEYGWPWHDRQSLTNAISQDHDDRNQEWRMRQPAARISDLGVVDRLTAGGRAPRLVELYQARSSGKQQWPGLAFEPLAELFLFGLLSRAIGNSSPDWLRLARGEKVAMPPLTRDSENHTPSDARDFPDFISPPKHSLTFTIRSSLRWPDGLRARKWKSV